MVRDICKKLKEDGHKFYSLFVVYDNNMYHLDDFENTVHKYTLEDGAKAYKQIYGQGRSFYVKENLRDIPTLLVELDDFEECYHTTLISLFESSTLESYVAKSQNRRDITISDEYEKKVHKESYWGYSESNGIKQVGGFV